MVAHGTIALLKQVGNVALLAPGVYYYIYEGKPTTVKQ